MNIHDHDRHQQMHFQDYGRHEGNYNSFLLDSVSWRTNLKVNQCFLTPERLFLAGVPRDKISQKWKRKGIPHLVPERRDTKRSALQQDMPALHSSGVTLCSFEYTVLAWTRIHQNVCVHGVTLYNITLQLTTKHTKFLLPQLSAHMTKIFPNSSSKKCGGHLIISHKHKKILHMCFPEN